MTHDLRPGRAAASADHELALLVERDYVAYASAFERAPAITVLRTPEVVARRGEIAHPYLNLVLGTWTQPAAVDRLVATVHAEVGGPGRPFTWAVWPSNTPRDLGERLGAAGFRHDDDGPLMTLDLDAADLPDDLPPGLTIELATDPQTLAEASPVTMSIVGDDPAIQAVFTEAYRALAFGPERSMAFFVGRLDGRPVATSALFTGTGVAGLYGVGTLPGLRGRGYGRALTIAALAEGRRRGLRIGALLSSRLGLPVYRRLGFRAVGSVAFYASPADANEAVSPAS